MSDVRSMMGFLVLWCALVGNVGGGVLLVIKTTTHFDTLAAGIAANTKAQENHKASHTAEQRYVQEFRDEVKQSLRDIKNHQALSFRIQAPTVARQP